MFPVGNAGDYRPGELRFSSPGATATYAIEASRAPAPNASAVAAEGAAHLAMLLGYAHWFTSRLTGADVPVVRIPYDPAITTEPDMLTIAGYNPVTRRWKNLGLVARDPAAGWVEANLPPPAIRVRRARMLLPTLKAFGPTGVLPPAAG